MKTTVEQILVALNAESDKATDGFLTNEEYATHLHEFISSNPHQASQPIEALDIEILVIAFAAFLNNQGIVESQELRDLIRKHQSSKPAFIKALRLANQSNYDYFMERLNEAARTALQSKGSLTLDKLAGLDPWFLILRKK
jgi:hypothetical protein